MDFNIGLILKMNSNLILPSLAAFSVVLLVVQKLYIKLRSKFPIKRNCWFCNTDSRVPYNSSNSWYCPNCDQYNGFTIDGSYNRLLPEQFNEKLNCGAWCTRTREKTNVSSNGLCQFCNINLELKIQQLAQFIPLNTENHDEEVQQYSDQLERVYRLCSHCQSVLKKTIEKQEVLLTNQDKAFNSLLKDSNSQIKENKRHSVYLLLTATLSACLLLSALPFDWVSPTLENYFPPEYILEIWMLVEEYIPSSLLPSLLLLFGVVVHLFDCLHMRDTTSFTNLLLWIILLSLSRIPVKVDGLVTVVTVFASIVFFITSLAEYGKKQQKTNIATVKPVQLQRFNKKMETTPGSNALAADKVPVKSNSPQSNVSDTSPTKPIPNLSLEATPDDFGFGKLNVNSRRVTRSQTKHFQAKEYKSQGQSDLFRPKPFSLTPPKLQLDKALEYQLPLTRSSSQSSGFVSMSQQRDFDDYRSPSPSLIAENIESVSQCGEGILTPYRSQFLSPNQFPHPFGMPFSNFQPYTIMHFTPSQFNKCYPYSNMLPYEPSLNLSNHSMQNKVEDVRWYHHLKSALSSLVFIFLITSNIAILWKVFGEEFFEIKS